MRILIAIICMIAVQQSLMANAGKTYKETIYAEEFSLPWQSSWPTGTADKLEKEVADGAYVLTNKDSKAKMVSMDIPIDTDRNFEIEIALKIDSAPDNSVHGVNWGMSGEKDYGFYITALQNFSIARWDGSYDNYQDYTTTAKVKRRAYNHMVVKRNGYHMLFYINGSLMHRMPFRKFYGKGIGLQVGANSRVRVDFVRVSYLSSTKPGTTALPDSSYMAMLESPFHDELYDDFHNNENKWPESAAELKIGPTGGQLSIKNTGEDYRSVVKYQGFNFQRDYTIITQISQQKGGPGNETALLMGDPLGRSLRFGFTPDGYCTLYLMENGQADVLLDFTYVEAVHFDMARANGTELAISKRGGHIYCFANGEPVYSGRAPQKIEGAFGYLIGPGASVKADYLRVATN